MDITEISETPRYVIVDENGDAKEGEDPYPYTVDGLDRACYRLGEIESIRGERWEEMSMQPFYVCNPAGQTVGGVRFNRFGLTMAEVTFINNVWGFEFE